MQEIWREKPLQIPSSSCDVTMLRWSIETNHDIKEMTSGKHDSLSVPSVPVFLSHIYLNKTGRLWLYRTSLVQKYTVQQISLSKVSMRNLVQPNRCIKTLPSLNRTRPRRRRGSDAFPQTADENNGKHVEPGFNIELQLLSDAMINTIYIILHDIVSKGRTRKRERTAQLIRHLKSSS